MTLQQNQLRKLENPSRLPPLSERAEHVRAYEQKPVAASGGLTLIDVMIHQDVTIHALRLGPGASPP